MVLTCLVILILRLLDTCESSWMYTNLPYLLETKHFLYVFDVTHECCFLQILASMSKHDPAIALCKMNLEMISINAALRLVSAEASLYIDGSIGPWLMCTLLSPAMQLATCRVSHAG